MTYEEIKKRLTEVESTLQNMQRTKSPALETSYSTKSIHKLTTLKESLQKQLLAEEETMFVTTKGGDTKAVKMDMKTATDLKKDPAITGIDTAKGKSIKEVDRLKKLEGIEFDQNETTQIAQIVGKSLGKALIKLGDELARLKAIRIEPNAFDVYVEYKGDRTGDDEFSFYINDNSLHLVDFTFDKKLVEIGVKPSGDPIINKDVLINELLKHFKSLNEESVVEGAIKDMHIFLNDLRDSGVTNMFGAGPYLQDEFGLDKKEARQVLANWMKSFGEGLDYKDRKLNHEEEDRLDLIAHREFNNDFSKLSDEDKAKVFAKRDQVGIKEVEASIDPQKLEDMGYNAGQTVIMDLDPEIFNQPNFNNYASGFIKGFQDNIEASQDYAAYHVNEGINDEVHFGFDLDAIQAVVDYLKEKYEEGKDYELFIGRGDDLPNTVKIINPRLHQNTALNDLLNYAQSDEDRYDAYTSDDLNEGTELYDKGGLQIKRFSGGKRGVMVQITAPSQTGFGGDYIQVTADQFVTLAKAMQSVQGDLMDMSTQMPRRKNIDEIKAAKIQKAHSQVVAKMKELAKQYKAGDKSVVSQLKDLTVIKKGLEKHLDQAVAGIGSQYTEPGDMLKEFTDNRFKGSQVIDDANKRGPDMFGKQIFADLLPKGVASENDAIEALKAHDKSPIKARMGQYAPMFVHLQYHDLEHEGEKYRMHQTQYYNSNFKDKDPSFNPGVSKITLFKITKPALDRRDREETDELGTIIVKTDQYVQDLRNLPGLGKRVSEAKGGQIMPGDYVKNQHGNIYQRVDGKVGRHDAYVRVINGKVGKRKTGLHDSFKLTLVDKDELKENVKVGDILTKDGKKGKVVKVMDDMANVDFGNGDVYGITFGRIKGSEITKEDRELEAWNDEFGDDAESQERIDNEDFPGKIKEGHSLEAKDMQTLKDAFNHLFTGSSVKFTKLEDLRRVIKYLMDTNGANESAPGYKHDCAAKVVHETYGKGTCIPEKHTLVKEGKKYVVTHYDVLFENGKTVTDIPVSELKIKTQNEHWHKNYKKKKK